MVDEYHLPSHFCCLLAWLDSTLTAENIFLLFPFLLPLSRGRSYLPISRNDDGFFLLPSVKRALGAPARPALCKFSMLPSYRPSFLPVSISWGKLIDRVGTWRGKFLLPWLELAGSASLKRHSEVMGGDISHGRLCWRPATVIAAKLMTRMLYVATARTDGRKEQSTHDRFGAFPDN